MVGDGLRDSQRHFGEAMEHRADDAAQAAVTFADAIADEASFPMD